MKVFDCVKVVAIGRVVECGCTWLVETRTIHQRQSFQPTCPIRPRYRHWRQAYSRYSSFQRQEWILSCLVSECAGKNIVPGKQAENTMYGDSRRDNKFKTWNLQEQVANKRQEMNYPVSCLSRSMPWWERIAQKKIDRRERDIKHPSIIHHFTFSI